LIEPIRHNDKFKAIRAAQKEGFTIHYGTGSCGGRPFGSRLYYKKPSTPWLNTYAEISQVTDVYWQVAIFDLVEGVRYV
jgi:hypothetical protein